LAGSNRETNEADFLWNVADRLRAEGLKFKSEVSVSGLQVDLVVSRQDRLYIIEVKSSRYSASRLFEAVEQQGGTRRTH